MSVFDRFKKGMKVCWIELTRAKVVTHYGIVYKVSKVEGQIYVRFIGIDGDEEKCYHIYGTLTLFQGETIRTKELREIKEFPHFLYEQMLRRR